MPYSEPTGRTQAKSIVLPCALSLGDYVFFDNDDSGAFDAGDAAVPAGVTLSLLDGSGNPVDGDPVTAGVQPAVTTTNAQGQYLFDGLLADTYVVRVDAGNFGASGALTGTLSSTATTASSGLASAGASPATSSPFVSELSAASS